MLAQENLNLESLRGGSVANNTTPPGPSRVSDGSVSAETELYEAFAVMRELG